MFPHRGTRLDLGYRPLVNRTNNPMDNTDSKHRYHLLLEIRDGHTCKYLTLYNTLHPSTQSIPKIRTLQSNNPIHQIMP